MAKMIDIDRMEEVSMAMRRLTERFRNETPFFIAGALEVHAVTDAAGTSTEHLGTIVLDVDWNNEQERMYFKPAG